MTTPEKVLHLTTKHSDSSYTIELTIPLTGIKETHIVTKEGSLWTCSDLATNSLTSMIRVLKSEMEITYNL